MNVWELPGPTRWTRPVRTAITDGTTVITVHPNAATPDGWTRHMETITASHRPVRRFVSLDASLADETAGSAELVARRVADQLGFAVAAGERANPADIITSDKTDATVLFVDARHRTPGIQVAWVNVARAATAGAKNTPADERATLIVAIDDPGAAPPTDTNLAVTWWWQVIGPLDTAVVVSDHETDPVRAATIVELARWDLNAARTLAVRWDGTPRSAHELLAGTLPHRTTTHGTTSTATPDTPEVIKDRQAGTIDAWRGRIDHSPATEPATIARRIWHGQVSSLFPWLEELRAVVVPDLAAAARRYSKPDADELEHNEWGWIGHYVLVEHKLPLGPQLRDLVSAAWTTRNDLAHRRPVSGEQIGRLRSAAANSAYQFR